MIFAGIDGGSRTLKGVLLDGESGQVLAKAVRDQGVEHERLAAELLDDLLREAGLRRRDVAAVTATGYARNLVRFADFRITEISCHAAGVARLFPEVRSIVEIGGQDSKVIRLGPGGRVLDFAMNDRCAAGTGRFLEMTAVKLEASLEGLGRLARAAREPSPVSSMCAVFAETEIIGLLASGASKEGIAAGLMEAMARRVVAMAGRKLGEPLVFTGGVARVGGFREALEKALGFPVQVPPEPVLTGALGAALLGAGRGGPRPGPSLPGERGGGKG